MIIIKNLCLKYIREYYALYDINLSINKGEKVALVGSEESGKTSLIRVIAKLEKINGGDIYINNIPLKKVDYKSDLSVGYLPVKPIYLKKKTIYQNFYYLLKERKISKEEIENRIDKVLKSFDIEKYKEEKFESLSVFDKYVVSLARLALRDLDLLLIDNIFEDINLKQIEKIKELLKTKFLNKAELTAIVATSSENLAKEITENQIYFKFGSIVESLEETAEASI